MTKSIEDIRRYFAEEIMGYSLFVGNLVDKETPISYSSDVEYPIVEENWKPDQNLSQAFECLEEYCGKNKLTHSYQCPYQTPDKVYEFYLGNANTNKFVAEYRCEDKANAIIGVILLNENKTDLLGVLESEV